MWLIVGEKKTRFVINFKMYCYILIIIFIKQTTSLSYELLKKSSLFVDCYYSILLLYNGSMSFVFPWRRASLYIFS